MEAIQQEQKTWHSVAINGKWKLDYKVSNPMGPTAFGGKHLSAYPNPFTRQKTYLKGVNGEPLSGLMIDKITRKLFPDNNPEDLNLIHWLLCHPEVKIKGVKDLDQKIIDSKGSTKITLTCLDYVEMNEIDEEDFVDRINGRLSLDGGKESIGLEKIRYVLARLGQSYREVRFEGAAEKKFLRSKLKSYVRKSYDNAKNVEKAINDLENSKDYFEFKEMVKHGILVLNNGLYKYNDTPLGGSFDAVKLSFTNSPEVKMELTRQLYLIIK
jgi:hypothetical protein